MIHYTPADATQKFKEISDAISMLKKHGFDLNLSDDLKKTLDPNYLFDGDDAIFKSIVNDVNFYFEYGCGKSTEYMMRHSTAKIFSVDTSREWATKMQSIADSINPQRASIQWIDVGPVADWGNPINFNNRHNYMDYTNWFWTIGHQPDLVLIDGRFRVCCFLTTVKHANVGTKVIFDDYADRPFYHVAEDFLPIIDKCGRQALFEVTEQAKSMVTDEIIATFRNVIQ